MRLPEEIENIILYRFGGLSHPTSKLIKNFNMTINNKLNDISVMYSIDKIENIYKKWIHINNTFTKKSFKLDKNENVHVWENKIHIFNKQHKKIKIHTINYKNSYYILKILYK